jgi:hypothetical protein
VTFRPTAPPPPATPPPKARSKRFPRWRPFTWIILAFNVVMLIWVILGANTGKSCHGLSGNALTDCQAGQAGTTIGVGLIILLWALGDVILGTVWLITKPRRRDCPVCGNPVRRGVMECPNCGFDFTTIAQQPGRPPGPRWGGPR